MRYVHLRSVRMTIAFAVLGVSIATQSARSSSTANTITFSVPVQVDPQRFVTEPSIAVAPWGAVFTSGPWGFSTGQSFLWRSLDRSNSYDIEQLTVSPVGLRPCSTPIGPGGGDTDQ